MEAKPLVRIRCSRCGGFLRTRKPRPDILCFPCRFKEENPGMMIVTRIENGVITLTAEPVSDPRLN